MIPLSAEGPPQLVLSLSVLLSRLHHQHCEHMRVTLAGVVHADCCDYVAISGAEAVQASRMGTFVKTANTSNNRPVYQNSNGEFLYYWAASTSWQIGPNYTSSPSWVYATGAVDCPSDVTQWSVWSGSTWSSSYGVTSECIATCAFATSSDCAASTGSCRCDTLQCLHVVRHGTFCRWLCELYFATGMAQDDECWRTTC